LFIICAAGHFLVRQSQMGVVWWFQMNPFLSSMAEKWPLPYGLPPKIAYYCVVFVSFG